MKILFLCTAHNSLSQRLSLELSAAGHQISFEYALSDAAMIEAVTLFKPALVICPFLTSRVPKTIYSNIMTLIMHPGPPGDAGPSAIDWLLMGDDGTIDDPTKLLQTLNQPNFAPGRSHWGITILQAVEQFDAGPVWAFDQFPIDIDESGMTKAQVYRGPVCTAAVKATWSAISRLQAASESSGSVNPMNLPPTLKADARYRQLSVSGHMPFQGGKTHHRPLLKAAQREIHPSCQTAQQVSRRIRCADSQPGVLSEVFGSSLFIYGGILEDNPTYRHPVRAPSATAGILGTRGEAVCISTCDGKGVWVTHVRRPKADGPALWPKVPALSCLLELGLLMDVDLNMLDWPLDCGWMPSSHQTFQEVWVDIEEDENDNLTAYLYFDFYNGAMTTDQCSHLIEAMDYIISQSTSDAPIRAVALMGGSYFSNGIALNVIEAAGDPAEESWANINRIDDFVHYLLHEFPSRNILTVAAVRGNAAAGGVALATTCDIVIAGAHVVLNPAYRAVGLFGSEYHTLSYHARCGKAKATNLLRAMTPLSPLEARRIGLIDYVFPDTGAILEDHIKTHITLLLAPRCLTRGFWKSKLDLSPTALARTRAAELSEMSKDFWSPRTARYHGRRFDFVRKVKPTRTPLRFAKHRRGTTVAPVSPSAPCTPVCDLEESDAFDDVEFFRVSAEQQLKARLRDQIREEQSTPRRLSVVNLAAGPKAEPMFSCYYRPVGAEDVLTPPETPFETPLHVRMVEGGSFFAGVEGRC